MEFNERVLTARKSKGYSQEDLAELVGVSRQAVSKWETGEAMPDMEKCIALCEALDLSMEYLALGKESQVPAPAPRKVLPWLGVTLLAVLCLGAGFLTRHLWPWPEEAPVEVPEQEPIIQTVVVEKEVIVEVDKNCPIADVQWAGTKTGRVRILPAVVKEDMTVQLLCENRNNGNRVTRVDCTFNGTYFEGHLPLSPENRWHYYIVAIITADGETKQLPILEVEGDSKGYSTRQLWKNR